MTTGKTIALTRWTSVGKVMSLLFNTLPRFVIAFLPKSKHLFNFMAVVTVCSDSSMLLLLLSCFSHVRLCATPQMVAHQASPSLGPSRQEHWSGLPFSSPMHESESEVAQLCPTPSDPMDCSLPGPSVHGIFQARVLEWGAIAFSDSSMLLLPGCLSRVRLCATP